MTAVLLSRIIGLIIFALIGFFTGKPIHNYLATVWSQSAMFNPVITVIVTVVLFGLIGLSPLISQLNQFRLFVEFSANPNRKF